ncbi:MAG: hypothetical protein ACRDD3_03385 [Azovibrio sp.]
MDDPGYFPEDRLIFRGVLESMAPSLPQEQQADANRRLEELKPLRTTLGREFDQALQMPPLGKSLGKLIKGKMATFESWEKYLEKIKALESPLPGCQVTDHRQRWLSGNLARKCLISCLQAHANWRQLYRLRLGEVCHFFCRGRSLRYSFDMLFMYSNAAVDCAE